MRTTLTLDEDSLEIARRFAKGRRISLGKAVSDLLRRGATRPHPSREVNGLTVFDLPEDSPVVSAEKVKQLENEGG
ncbi:MAG: DUF6364 family protein [Chthoniobacterales bacterium]